ncbi:glycosyltransferase family 2 protein [Paenibacillus sacheonensis]|uniref:Glycosyltransferase n=1 Tax=Paenibacillus sacheonensis TaxID=742054 RepID=A0A7X4YX25_9BACL|nr:glycosyltransferase family A protein [Paenibacillus sacheonensis]MBM7566463.1 glycosyltransferase involved in cell wall biosynthesis [Paenibacillus sacheonensis]NBC73146.1 glycosyltransferase [Paenibacillus sacheonensis]
MGAKVSLVVACYNKALYLGETLRSIMNQVWDNIEVVLVNDGSTDETVQVLHKWRPRLLDRGYDVVIISQPNSGVAAALKNGLVQSRGQYVCFPDADDELDSEYVSLMINAIEADKGVNFAVCGLAERSVANGTPMPINFADKITPNTTIEEVLLQRVHSSICVYLVKREYAERCGLTSMVTEDATSQEPQMTTLLYAGGGKLVQVEKCLYIYNTFASNLAGGRGEQNVSEHYRNRLNLYKRTIAQLSRSPFEKERLMELAAIGCRYMAVSIEGDGENEIFLRSLTNRMLRIEPNHLHLTGRIIAYGALGRVARSLLPLMKGTPLQPDMLWDAAADASSKDCNGSVVVKPDETQVERGYILICFPKSHVVFEEATKLAASKGAKVLSWNDVIDYLSNWYYPVRNVVY